MKIPMVDLVDQYQKIEAEIDGAIKGVLNSGAFIQGPQVKELERAVAAYLECSYGVSCASGTDALQVALIALGIGEDDEVIIPSFTFVATAEVIVLLKARLVFVDIDPRTYTIDVSRIEGAITGRTKAIIPVHLYGQSAEMDGVNTIARKYDLKVIEDAAQAIGATYKSRRVGSLGDVGCLSFFPSKNLGAYGDGGMLTTGDENLAQQMKMITLHGSNAKYRHQILGVNSRLDTLQAAILLVKLKYLDGWNQARAERAARYSARLKDMDVVLPFVEEHNGHVFHQYSIRVKDRDGLRGYLSDKGIATAVHYPIPLHLQEAFRFLGYKKGDFPVSEQVSMEILSLPMHPDLKEEQIDFIADTIKDYLKN
ncbi:DegT/DnrJ/EryC1/StrS family aminotransferase [candidate division KSB1 bacterium]|nr:DegT/DnrJ/EryC1/StrS family aminotransferase [candidate division KSB1 bacterium]